MAVYSPIKKPIEQKEVPCLIKFHMLSLHAKGSDEKQSA